MKLLEFFLRQINFINGNALLMDRASSRFEIIQERIASAAQRVGRAADSIRLIGVSKKQTPEKIIELAQLGLKDFGENYVQEWKLKKGRILQQASLQERQIKWHFIGHLQSNKVVEVIGQCETIQSIDSLKLAEKISELAIQRNLQQKLLLQINPAHETSKSGLSPEALLKEWPRFAALPNLLWEGLMTVPPLLEPVERVRPHFAQLRSLLDECNRSGLQMRPMRELSMGMSQDFEIAIEEGATMIRIGTALFGPRS